MTATAILSASGIYAIRNTVNSKVYVGSAKNIKKRWYVHKRQLINGTHHSKKLQAAWNEFGSISFCFEVIEFVDDVSALLAREQVWMDENASASACGYNTYKTAGSPSGSKHSDETKKKLSIIQTGMKKPAASLALTGLKKSPDHVAKVALSNTGKKRSEETRKRISIANIGKHSNHGRPHTEESKKAIGDAVRRSCALRNSIKNQKPIE